MKFFYFLLLIISLISCNKNDVNNDNKLNDVNYYLKKINNGNSSDKSNLKYNDLAFYKIKAQNNSSEKRRKLDEIANNYFNFNEWEKYKLTSRELLKISKSANDSLYYAKSLRYLGNYYYKIKSLDSSFHYYSKAEKYFFKIQDTESYSIILLKKGIVQYAINDFLGADYSLRKAYNILKNTKDYQRTYAALNALGSVSSELKENGRAISYYENALGIIKKGNIQTDEHQEANCLNNIGLVYSETKNFKKAIYYYTKALSNKALKTDNPELYSILIDNLAYSKFKSNDLKNLPKLFFDALKITNNTNNINAKVVIFIHLSEYYSVINDTVRAIEYSTKAINLSNKNKTPIFTIASLKQASSVDKKNSSKYSDKYIHISDSIQIAERKSKDRFARIQFETDEILQESDNYKCY